MKDGKVDVRPPQVPIPGHVQLDLGTREGTEWEISSAA
jgi:hypothetical protein